MNFLEAGDWMCSEFSGKFAATYLWK